MKQLISRLLMILLLTGILMMPVSAVVEQSDSYYVADYANVLSPETEQEIIDANAKLEQTCHGAQIVVVTIDYLDSGYYADEYARILFNNWEVGPKDENNGMLLLLVTEEAKGWLVTGAGLTNKISNQEVNNLLDNYFWDYVDDGKYEKAVTSVFDRLLNWYEDEYDAGLTENGGQNGYGPSGSYEPSYRTGPSPFMMLILLIIVLSLLNSSARRVRRRGGNVPWWVWWMMCNDRGPRGPRGPRGGPPPPPPGGFGGFGGGGGFHGGGGFGGGIGHGGGGFSGGGGGRR